MMNETMEWLADVGDEAEALWAEGCIAASLGNVNIPGRYTAERAERFVSRVDVRVKELWFERGAP